MRQQPRAPPDLDHSHAFGTVWKSDAAQHWHECSCGEKTDIADHAFGGDGICTVCGYDGKHEHDYGTAWESSDTQHWHECDCGEKSNLANHAWHWVTTKAVTETETGLRTEACSVCGRTSGNTQIIQKTDPNHEHAFGADWEKDAAQHWHECACGEKTGLAYHAWQWEITSPATTEAAGLETETCTVCRNPSGNTRTIPQLVITYTVSEYGGTLNITDTAGITLIFDTLVDDLTIDNITLGGVIGKGSA
jgi:hypothetical protein